MYLAFYDQFYIVTWIYCWSILLFDIKPNILQIKKLFGLIYLTHSTNTSLQIF